MCSVLYLSMPQVIGTLAVCSLPGCLSLLPVLIQHTAAKSNVMWTTIKKIGVNYQ